MSRINRLRDNKARKFVEYFRETIVPSFKPASIMNEMRNRVAKLGVCSGYGKHLHADDIS